MKKVKLGFVGLGQRGAGLFIDGGGLIGTVFAIDCACVSAVCDSKKDRVERAAKIVADKGFPEPYKTTDYNDLIKNADVDAIIVSTSWSIHVAVAIAAMQAGIPVAIEVGGTHSINDCYKLIEVYEKTKTPFMFLENCCYNKDELLALSLVRNGVLGSLSFCQGYYCHDLRSEIAGGIDTGHYRLKEYTEHNCENYPTHELGPIAKILDVNSGNRFTKLVSMSSKSQGLKEFIKNDKRYSERLNNVEFAQGDVTTTMIQCENGETVLIKLDTTLPRLYERGLTVSGTKGFYCQTTNSVIVDGGEFNHETDTYKKAFDSAEKYFDYIPKEWKEITPEQIEAGHGGMDYVMLKNYCERIRDKKPMPIDVYDAVTWMAVTALSEISIKNGSKPVDFPDFTNGKYKTRKRVDVLDLPKVVK